MAKLIGIAIRHKKRGPMQTLNKAFISLGKGVEDDFRGKPSKRQVTVMSQKAWQDANAILGTELPWTTRRANLLVDELDLENTAGKTIVVGDVVLRITQETDPCERMTEAATGLYDVLKANWRGGVCCRVISEGHVKLGDDVVLAEKVSK
ncbi:MOSC domain-containing protein [Kaarinaea lacus]